MMMQDIEISMQAPLCAIGLTDALAKASCLGQHMGMLWTDDCITVQQDAEHICIECNVLYCIYILHAAAAPQQIA